MLFFFEGSVIAIAIIGGISNLLMLLILAQSPARKNHEMFIVFNQMTVDFLSCLVLVISYLAKVVNIYYNMTVGVVFCKALTGEALIWCLLGSSTANLVVLTLERYVKIVHAMFHKRHFRPWMYYAAITMTWVSFDVVFNGVVGLWSGVVSNGQCLVYATFPAAINPTAYAIYRFFVAFVVPLVVFFFCYSQILQVTHKRVFPVNFNNMMKSAAQQNAMKTQLNVIKTFLFISICFVLCWAPNRIYFFLYNMHFITTFTTEIRYVTVFMAFLYLCFNPFIYAAKLDPVKKFLRQKVFRRKRPSAVGRNVTSVINVVDNTGVMQPTA